MFRILLIAAAVTLSAGLFIPQSEAQQESVDVKIDNTLVKAGELVSFTVTVDQPTNVADCYVRYQLTMPGGGYLSASVPLNRGQTTAIISYKVPFDSPAGRYELADLVFVSPGGKEIPLSSKKIGFDVTPNTDIKYPSSALVAINPSQVQLFRTEALALAGRLQELKGNERVLLAKGEQAVNRGLRNAVETEIEAIRRTANEFRGLGSSPRLSQVASVFFSDLELSYRRTAEALRGAARGQGPGPQELASGFFGPMESRGTSPHSFAREAVYRAAEQNELAYSLVADTGEMSFDLRVVSSPPGATVSYARRGDAFKDYPDPTSATIRSLPLAIWIIRFHKASFLDQEREFNPFTEREREIDVALQALGK